MLHHLIINIISSLNLDLVGLLRLNQVVYQAQIITNISVLLDLDLLDLVTSTNYQPNQAYSLQTRPRVSYVSMNNWCSLQGIQFSIKSKLNKSFEKQLQIICIFIQFYMNDLTSYKLRITIRSRLYFVNCRLDQRLEARALFSLLQHTRQHQICHLSSVIYPGCKTLFTLLKNNNYEN